MYCKLLTSILIEPASIVITELLVILFAIRSMTTRKSLGDKLKNVTIGTETDDGTADEWATWLDLESNNYWQDTITL